MEKTHPELLSVLLDKELRDLIRQDVDRTLQELEYFQSLEVKAELTNILYLWAKDNPETGYRQGMNEILAVLTIAIGQDSCKADSSSLEERLRETEEEEVSEGDISLLLFSSRNVFADVYWCFDRLMNMGIKYLYQVTRDISEIKKEIQNK
mmetsp:Transcript_6954/g.11698  ORF Transcript_6954/g.11698 Transcript_6954/m.11698 type:complete len:151 (-) Transcript_6954:332-784(-)